MIRSRASSRSRRPSAPRSPPNSLKSGRQPIGKHREKLALVDTQAGRPSEDRKCCQCVELGIHGLRAGAAKSLEKSEKRGVQAARNGPSLPPCVAKADEHGGSPCFKGGCDTKLRMYLL